MVDASESLALDDMTDRNVLIGRLILVLAPLGFPGITIEKVTDS